MISSASGLQNVQSALAALKRNRGLLDAELFEVASIALEEKITTLQKPKATPMQQYEQVSVLVADIAGFTAMSQYMDAETVRDTINAVWAKLDSIIVSWGGIVDKHVGDGVIALFGLGPEQEESAINAVQSALDMQLELAMFNDEKGDGRQKRDTNLTVRMRIGIHHGQVYYGTYGAKQEKTAVGDTVTTANLLEEHAPVDGILISHAAYEYVHPYFDVSVMELEKSESGSLPGRAYVVNREKPHAFRHSRGHTAFLDTRFISRSEELHLLQETMQQVVETEQCRVITVSGEAGVGKSRLLYEFERLLALQPEPIQLVRGGARPTIEQTPYALFHDLLNNHFDIHRRHIPSVAREKLVRGITQTLSGSTTKSLTQAHFIAHLLGHDTANSPYLQEVIADPRQMRRYGYQDLVQFFHALMADKRPLVLFLENLHLADESSLNLLEYLIQECREQPLFIVLLTRPALFLKRPSWQIVTDMDEITYQQLNLRPLTLIESRHLLSELLPRVDSLPMRLVDFAITGANGNPLQLEEIVTFLIEDGVIDTSGTSWLVRLGSLAEISSLTYEHLLRERVRRLPAAAQELLKCAALIGEFFWEDMLFGLVTEQSSPAESLELLLDIGFIHRRTSSSFPRTREYIFRHGLLHEIIVGLCTPRWRKEMEKRIAAWFIQVQETMPTTLPGVIAAHLLAAGQKEEAAIWFGRKAAAAVNEHAPETAVYYFRQALQHLPARAETGREALDFYVGLGAMLQRLAQFGGAVEAFTAVQAGAQQLHNSRLEIEANLLIFQTHFIQGELADARHHALLAQKQALETAQNDLLARAMVAVGWTDISRGEVREAVNLSGDLYKLTKEAQSALTLAYSRLLLGHIGRELGQYSQGNKALQESIKYFHQLDEPYWQIQATILLGRAALEQYQMTEALNHFEDALWLARDIRDLYSILLALRQTGKGYLYRGNFTAAQSNYQQAKLLVEQSNQPLFRAMLTLDIGELHLTQAVLAPMSTQDLQEKEKNLQDAYHWLEDALQLSRQVGNSLFESRSLSGLAELFLEDHLLDEAREHALAAIKEAERSLRRRPTRQARLQTAVSWRILGMTLAKEPLQRNQIKIGSRQVSANACFQRSKYLLEEVGQSATHELAKTCRAWGIYWLFMDNSEKSAPLLQEANQLFRQCDMAWETTIIEQLI